jgi:cystathionine beta-synthase
MQEDDMMVIILPDHGTRYLGKVYNDTWMRDHGFFESREFATAKDIVRWKGADKLETIGKNMKISEAIQVLNKKGISQLPVCDGNDFVGSITDTKILNMMIEKPGIRDATVGEIMDAPLQFVAMDNTVDVLSSLINNQNKALLVRDKENAVHIITQHDLLMAMTTS